MMERRTQPPSAFHLRDLAGERPSFDGIAVPYGTPARVGGVTEVFARDAFNAADIVGVPILWQHDTASVAGIIRSAQNTPDGLHVTGELIDTSWGRDATAAVRSGAIKGLSVGFTPDEDVWDGTTVTRAKATLMELSFATLPAYPDAQVTAVRKQEEPMPEPTADHVTRADLDALESRIKTSLTPAPQGRTLGVVEAFVTQLRVSAEGRQMRALSDVINTGNAGLLPPQWSREVRNFIDRQRYMIPQAGSIGFPSAGYTLTLPKVLTHTLIAPRGAQKSEIPSRALTTGSDTYTATWYAGGVDVALELIWQSDPSVWEIIVSDLLWAYADTTDKAFTLAVETAGQPTGAVLPFTNWGVFVAAVLTQAEAIRLATGQFGDRLSLTSASWGKLVGLTDADGRRILAPTGSVNADGAASLLDRSVNIGGIVAFHNPRAVEDVLFNQVSVRVAEKPPVTIQADDVAKMGRDVGVIGAMMDVLYPAGIKTFSATE